MIAQAIDQYLHDELSTWVDKTLAAKGKTLPLLDRERAINYAAAAQPHVGVVYACRVAVAIILLDPSPPEQAYGNPSQG